MLEFRFLKGKWPFGKYKLQFKRTKEGKWQDVPTVEEEKCPAPQIKEQDVQCQASQPQK